MDFDELFDFTAPMKKIHVPGCTFVRPKTSKLDTVSLEIRERQGTEFSKTLRQKQETALCKNFEKLLHKPINHDALTDCESIGGETATNTEDGRILEQRALYNRFAFNQAPFNPNLPIYEFRERILTQIREEPVLVIQGETGCGKSTQVPQFILDDAYTRGEYCNIVVTQPRRIAAITLSEQVSRERGYTFNTLVGYQIGLDRNVSEDTRITYCTTGVLLEKLIQTKGMGMYTHIILDEIHERDEDMEFLLIAIKRNLVVNPFSTKIILMSATIDTNQFAKYFRLPSPTGGMKNAPMLSLTGRRQHDIFLYYLDDLIRFDGVHSFVNYDQPGIEPQMYRVACTIIQSFSTSDFSDKGFCVLLFLPGIHEIAEMHLALETERKRALADDKELPVWNILPLHSVISSVEQRRVFQKCPPKEVNIILATNIAESSITVPDVKFVIDFCLTRTLEVDQNTGFSMLRLKWASRNSCEQRSGRAGRTCSGRCYRLVSKIFYKDGMSESETSALARCSLEKVVLKAKKLDKRVIPAEIIGLALEPPDFTDIRFTILKLKEARGFHLKTNGRYIVDDGDMTYIGEIMESLPLDIRATRLIIMGYMFDVLEECIIMAAGLTVHKVFALHFKEPIKTYAQKMIFADGSGSDLFAILHAYQYMVNKIDINPNTTLNDNIVSGANRCNLDVKGIYEMYQLVDEIGKRLEPFKLQSAPSRIGLSVRHRNMILKVCIAGAFYPNYFLRSSCISREEQERQIFHDMNGRDPTKTVFYRGIGKQEMGMLYEDQVKSFLKANNVIKSKDDAMVSFDEGSQKMYVTFVEKPSNIVARGYQDSLPGNVKMQVYKAIKLTRERTMMRLRLLDNIDMYKYAEHVGLGRREGNSFVHTQPKMDVAKLCCVPRLHEKQVAGYVTHSKTPSKFWIRPLMKQHELVVAAIENTLKAKRFLPYPHDDVHEVVGKKVVVELKSGLYRARVESVVKEKDVAKYNVFLIDEGTEETVTESQLRSMVHMKIDAFKLGLKRGVKIPLADIPPCIFEASLAEIRPSYLTSASGKWTNEANIKFRDLTKDEFLFIEIYSFWNGVASVKIQGKHGKTINEELIDLQLAEGCEESYPSKYDHVLRFKTQMFPDVFSEDDDPYLEIEEYVKEFNREPIKPPPEELCSKIVTLRGPRSPLETTIHSSIRSLYSKILSIERFSVNSVLLDTDSNDPTDRLLVAANCGSDMAGSKFVLRNTTIMPNIQGFGSLMAMLFSPMVEIHPDKEGTRYNSILCGLGYDQKKKKGYFEEHDLIMNLDCALDQDDLLLINKIRYTMSAFLYTKQGEKVPELTSSGINDLRKTLIADLMKYLEKQRKLIDVRFHSASDHQWGLLSSDDVMEIPVTNVYGERAIFPGFSFKGLTKETEKEINDYRQNNKDLYEIAFGHKMMGSEFKCILCSKTLTSVPEAQIHIFRKLHKDQVKQYGVEFDLEKFSPETKDVFDITCSLYEETFDFFES